ncbi:MAG: cell division protein FtsQ [Frankiaceae bacterium]|jgi:cell division protein FtsQ|nr:cell division protein FtsQ [Frankiaceae bacterium]
MRAPATVVGAQRRFVARRRAGRRRAARPLILVLAGLITLGAGGWLALNSSLVAVRTITVEGTSRLVVADVMRVAAVRRGTSLFRLDSSAVARRVARIPAVAHVEVARNWPHGVVISVTERTPVAVVRGPTGAVLLDRVGVAFDTEAEPPPGLVNVQLSAPVPGAGDPAARAALQVLGALPTGVRRRVATVQAPSPFAVTLVLNGGRTVVWGSAADSTTKAAVLHALLHRHARVFDVSTPDVVVTR